MEENKKEESLEELETKVDVASENQQIEEVKPEETNEPQNFVYDGSLQEVEDNRKVFLVEYKKSNTWKWVVALLGLAIIIFSWVGFPNIIKAESGSPLVVSLQIGGAVFGLLCVLGYTLLSKRILNKKMRAYFRKFYEATAEYVFDQPGFSNYEVTNPDKLSLDEFEQCGMYRNLVEVGSRGRTSFEYNSIPIMVSDAAGQVKGTQRILPVFVGKYLYAKSNYADENPIFIYIKGTDKPLPPTNTEGMKIVEDDDTMTIYTNNSAYKKSLSPAFRKLLGQIKLNKDLVDIAISLKQGQCFVCLGYDDPLMVLPLQNPFNPHPYEGYKKDLLWACKVIEELNK